MEGVTGAGVKWNVGKCCRATGTFYRFINE